MELFKKGSEMDTETEKHDEKNDEGSLDKHDGRINYWGEIKDDPKPGSSCQDDSKMEVPRNEIVANDALGTGTCNSIQDHSTDMTETVGSTADPFLLMLDRIAQSDAHFKHQQRDEPDLSYKEKSEIAKKLFETKPDQFLARFGKYLSEQDLELFKHLESDYTIQFYLKEVRQLLNSNLTQTKIKNRRYQAMLRMTSEGEYFSNEEMKERDPLLYEQMIGQFVTVEEADEEVKRDMDRSDLRFSSILMKHMQWSETNQLYKVQKDVEEGQEEESEDEDEDDDDDDENMEESGENLSKWVPSEKERQLMRQEFLHMMQERFMSGKDKYFDYSTVDENPEYDDLDACEHDEEDKYFDEEDPENIADDMDFDDADFKMPKWTPGSRSLETLNKQTFALPSDDGPS